VFFEFVYEAIPSQDVSVFVRHRRKVKPLGDESAIAEKEHDEIGAKSVGKALRNYITSVLLERDLRRLGSCVMTWGLLGG
jgi:hypothetical protein